MAISDYHASGSDWRAQLKKNERKTLLVILLFIASYLVVGLIADVFITQNYYINTYNIQLPWEDCLYKLLTFKIIPYASLIMVGIALVSLWVTYFFYDRIMLLGTEYHEVTQNASSLEEKKLYNVVEEMKVAAGLQYMPKIFIIEANYMNAFASGFSEKSAMVAITRGLMERLDRQEMQAVMAHELSHIRHHDIKLTLMVGVLSNILLLVMDVLFYSMLFKNEKSQDNRLATVIVVLRYALPLITVLLTLFLSRTREYMADSGCVELMRTNDPMGRALLKISQDYQANAEQYTQEYGNTPHEEVRQASYLFDPTNIDPVKSLSSAFSTHPTVEQRLAAIGFRSKKNK